MIQLDWFLACFFFDRLKQRLTNKPNGPQPRPLPREIQTNPKFAPHLIFGNPFEKEKL